MKMARALCAIMLLAAVVGCAETSPKPGVGGASASLDEAKVLKIAREAVAANDDWISRAEFETPVHRADGSWNVDVWRLPKTPGGDRLILINEKGEVTRYIRGR